jgi:RNA polymerase sigma-70 factor, ECF subfamily
MIWPGWQSKREAARQSGRSRARGRRKNLKESSGAACLRLRVTKVTQVNKQASAPDERTDEELAEAALADGGAAFALLYERYYTRTYRIAYGMTGRREAAEDLTQEVFVRAMNKLGQFNRRSSFSTWFHRLAVNCCLNHRRVRAGVREELTDELQPPRAAGRGEDEGILRKELQAHLHKALLSLKPESRLMILLKDVEGLSYEEIALRMNCPVGTVGTSLSRARRLLAQKLGHLRGKF